LARCVSFYCTSKADHINHVPQVSKLFADASAIVVTAFISPYKADRAVAREVHEKANISFIEVYVDAPLHVVEARDPKGLYKKARLGEIKGGFPWYIQADCELTQTRLHWHLCPLRSAGKPRDPHQD
jgi:adenylylsulfate kinase